MSDSTIRPAYSSWSRYNQAFRDIVAALTEEQLAIRPAPERWPLWATVGHTACQRVSWLCGVAGEPGAETTPFPNALYDCPGDDDLDHVWSASALADALDSTFRIVEGCLDRWTFGMLEEKVGEQTRGAILQRLFTHDAYHCGQLNEAFRRADLPQIDLWD